VGTLKAPSAGGWTDDPSKPTSQFKQYIVLTPLDSTRLEGSVGDPQSDWQFPYAMVAVGVAHSQVEGQADKARKIVNDIGKPVVSLGDESWKIAAARVNSIGGIDTVRTTDPPEFTQRDVVMVRISKENP
jgi:hypothetical protein